VITVYTFETADGAPMAYSMTDAAEAREHGRKFNLRVIANEYEFADSEVAWDYTGETSDE